METEEFDYKTYAFDALLVGEGELPPKRILTKWVERAPMVVCLDGAANWFEKRTGRAPDMVVGDGDSINERTRARYADRLLTEPDDQETNDLTKATLRLERQGMTRLAAVGLTGKREDHTLGNVGLMGWHMERGRRIVAATRWGVMVPCRGRVRMRMRKGQQVSVFAVKVKGLRSKGLRWDIYDFDYLWQGTLNEATEETVEIEGEGCYIVLIDYGVKRRRPKGK